MNSVFIAVLYFTVTVGSLTMRMTQTLKWLSLYVCLISLINEYIQIYGHHIYQIQRLHAYNDHIAVVHAPLFPWEIKMYV